MEISKQIRDLCVYFEISQAELGRRLGKSPQSFQGMLRRNSFTIEELEKIAFVLGITFEHYFVVDDGKRI